MRQITRAALATVAIFATACTSDAPTALAPQGGPRQIGRAHV